MKIPREFEDALERAYKSKSDLDRLFVEQKSFIMRLARWARRHNHWNLLSDEEDLFQEACIWIVDSMWKWDESKGTSLASYVVYNVGGRLQNKIRHELASRRTPKACSVSLSNHRHDDSEDGIRLEETLPGNEYDPEAALRIARAYQRIERELPLLARELLESLVLEGGNLAAASRRVRGRGRVRVPRDTSDNALKQRLARDCLPLIRSVLESTDIIPSA